MATVKKGKILRGDFDHWDGVNKTGSRPDSTGGTTSGLKLGDHVDVLQVYGSGTDYTVSTITTAVSAVGSNNVTFLFSTGTWTIDSNTTIPSNISCIIPSGCVFNVSNGVTLTFSGFVHRENDTWTSGSGTVTTSKGSGGIFSDTSDSGTGDALIGFLQSDSGGALANAVAGTIHTKLQEFISVRDFGVTGSGDETTALQNAISSGKNLDLVGLTIKANNLTQTTNNQRIFSSTGTATIEKNANGDLFTSSGDNVRLENVMFKGENSTPTFTGHNIVSSGNEFQLINCASYFAFGRAVKITGNRCQIIGTADIYQTAGALATDYDIEIGISGTATLYHHLFGIYTSQSDGGILLIDTGSSAIVGGQIGKYKVEAGTSPAGSGGNMISSCRILGAVDIELSNSILTGNHFGSSANITFSAATSNCSLDASNNVSGTVTNNGNANNLIIREVSSGSTTDLMIGDDSSAWIMKATPDASGNTQFSGHLILSNNKEFRSLDSGGSTGLSIRQTAADDVIIRNNTDGEFIQIAQDGAGFVQMLVNAATSLQVDSNSTAGNTRLLIYDVDNATLERVTVGAADSGGAGYKVLRIPN